MWMRGTLLAIKLKTTVLTDVPPIPKHVPPMIQPKLETWKPECRTLAAGLSRKPSRTGT